jgi:hypothetical protein
MHVHFAYRSQTQKTVHVTPFLWLICAGGWLTYRSDGTDALGGIGVMLAFGWLFLGNFCMNALVRHWGPRFGPIDLSRNASPTSTEKVLNGLILTAAVVSGVVAAAVSVQDIAPGLELKILVGGIVFLVVTSLFDLTLTLAVIVLSGFRIRPLRG